MSITPTFDHTGRRIAVTNDTTVEQRFRMTVAVLTNVIASIAWPDNEKREEGIKFLFDALRANIDHHDLATRPDGPQGRN
jgi:hypothetical protein